mmetsp:Transcript_24690/g.28436  ORF Transcript_24690/g.28436 Transcript_24690/m.28436 type:complete len:205 (+) Transcript_24690:149-763(+)
MCVTFSIRAVIASISGISSHAPMHHAFCDVRVVLTTFSFSPNSLVFPWFVEPSNPTICPPRIKASASAALKNVSKVSTHGPSRPPNSPPGELNTTGVYPLNSSSVAQDANNRCRSPLAHAGSVMLRCALEQRTFGSISFALWRCGSHDWQQCTIIHPGLLQQLPRAASSLQTEYRSRHGFFEGAAFSGMMKSSPFKLSKVYFTC